MRDRILHQQIEQLSVNVSADSKLFCIPSIYFNTSPWPSAQNELKKLFVCKTPRDKIKCIHRCCLHIMALLSVDRNHQDDQQNYASADDLLPVLIFVVIKANPKSILSTIQYINTFYTEAMTGEEAYYWTQFCSAIEFIKTLLNEQN
ncbi:hypothetical protein SSS_02067 [Sarcoptes scabiei]|nr:hypothetical protein SSS_02067 [Sarcoptes scabiei]